MAHQLLTMRRLTVLSTLLGVLSAACGQSAIPTSPAATEGSLRRIVGDVSGGNVGVCIPPNVCSGAGLIGNITLSSSQGTLTTAYPLTFAIGRPLTGQSGFEISAVQMTSTGQLADRDLALFVLSVSTSVAHIWVNFVGPNDGYFLAEGTATPSFSVTADSSCTSGQRIQTSIDLTLEHLGKTTVVDSHCVP